MLFENYFNPDFILLLMKKVIVIGDGALGLFSAYYLMEAGFEVTILSNNTATQADSCSFGNAGMVVPSHFIPLAAPGVIQQGLKWMLNAKSPLYIRPRLNRELFMWLWYFFQSANQKNVAQSKHILLQMHLKSRELFDELNKNQFQAFHYEQKGLMMLYRSAKCQDEEEHLAEQAREMGLSVKIYNQKELTLLEPSLKPQVLGGVLYESDAHLNPMACMKAMKALLIHRGVQFVHNFPVESFIVTRNVISAAVSRNRKIEGDEFVVCAGAWSTQLAKTIGHQLPLQGGKGYSITIPNIERNLNHPSILCEAKVAMTPLSNSLRVAGTMEIAGTDLSIQTKRLLGIQEQVSNYFSSFQSNWFNGLEPWAGLRPVSPDGLPYIGRSKKITNLSFNTGHAMMGISLAPISGLLLTEILSNQSPSIDMTICDPNRF